MVVLEEGFDQIEGPQRLDGLECWPRCGFGFGKKKEWKQGSYGQSRVNVNVNNETGSNTAMAFHKFFLKISFQ